MQSAFVPPSQPISNEPVPIGDRREDQIMKFTERVDQKAIDDSVILPTDFS